MKTCKTFQYSIHFPPEQEAANIVSQLISQKGCIDAWQATFSIEAYFATTNRSALPNGSRLVPTPAYFPGEAVTLLWYFPGVVSYSQVRIIHLSYLPGYGYRYYVGDERTGAGGWIDEEGLSKEIVQAKLFA